MKGFMILTATFILLGFVYLNAIDRQQAEIDKQMWCDAVREYKASDGKYGWPDNGHFDEDCRE